MSTRLLNPTVTAQIDGDPFTLSDYELNLDAAAVPYASGTVELPLLDDATLATVDPRDGVRVPVTCGGLTGGPRTFDLALRKRVVDHDSKTVTLTLASDEALLTDYTALTDDTSPRALESSLRDVCDYVLDLVSGAALEPGDDADVTAYWSLTNLVTNPSYEVSAVDVATSTNASGPASVVLSSPSPAGGTRALRVTATAADTSSFYPAGWSTTASAFRAIRVTPGNTYTASLFAVGSTARSARIGLQYRDEGGNVLGATYSPAAPEITNVLTRYDVSAEAPANASYASIIFETTGNSAGQFHYVDGVMLTEGPFLVDYFDGSLAPTGYTTEFTGDAHLSASTRTPIFERPVEALIWHAGQSAWDFLLVLCASAGLVLWCDEQRRWFLQSPEARTVPGLLLVVATNTREGTDAIDQDDEYGYVTGVLCRFSWTDQGGVARTRTDSAGTPGKVITREFSNTPYPGPGLAAAILARRAGTGRTQDVTVFTKWDATPGMTANISLPGAPDTTARVAAVTFHPDGFMSLEHSGLVDIIPGRRATIMAETGEAAAAAGMDLVSGSALAETLDTEINKTRDYIATLTLLLENLTVVGAALVSAASAADGRSALGLPDPSVLADAGSLAQRTVNGRLLVGTPVGSTDAVTKGYADGTYVRTAGDTISGDLTISGSGHHLYVPNATAATSSFTVGYIDGTGRLSKGASSERFKKFVATIVPSSLGDLFPALKRWKMRGGDGVWRYGYTAEQLAADPVTEPFVIYQRHIEEDGTAPHLERDPAGNPIPESIDFIGLLLAQVAQLNERLNAIEEHT